MLIQSDQNGPFSLAHHVVVFFRLSLIIFSRSQLDAYLLYSYLSTLLRIQEAVCGQENFQKFCSASLSVGDSFQCSNMN